ncbi:MAG: hypothetical protein JKY95_12305 [Planctomycetaceae bacterium]|nr:hypothetical protein [Planctomycetaceae bacterium]
MKISSSATDLRILILLFVLALVHIAGSGNLLFAQGNRKLSGPQTAYRDLASHIALGSDFEWDSLENADRWERATLKNLGTLRSLASRGNTREGDILVEVVDDVSDFIVKNDEIVVILTSRDPFSIPAAFLSAYTRAVAAAKLRALNRRWDLFIREQWKQMWKVAETFAPENEQIGIAIYNPLDNQPYAVNTTDQTIHHCTVRVVWKSIQGRDIEGYYFFNAWSPGVKKTLILGQAWSVNYNINSFVVAGELAVFCDEFRQKAVVTEFPEVRKYALNAVLDWAEKKMDLMLFREAREQLIPLTKEFAKLNETKYRNEKLLALADKYEKQEAELAKVCFKGIRFRGQWKQKRKNGMVGLEFNGFDKDTQDIKAVLFDHFGTFEQLKPLIGRIAPHPETKTFRISLKGMRGVGLQQNPASIPSTKNLLVAASTVEYEFNYDDGILSTTITGSSKTRDREQLTRSMLEAKLELKIERDSLSSSTVENSEELLTEYSQPGTTYSGSWKFIRKEGKVMVRFYKSDDPKLPIRAKLYAPGKSTNFKELVGSIEPDPDDGQPVLQLNSSPTSGRVLRAPRIVCTESLLVKGQTTKYKFRMSENGLVGENEQGFKFKLRKR